jgi:hypothetical protein
MTPASKIIERCGGPKSVADWLGLERTAVQRWTYDPPKGTGEQIPMKHWAPLIEAAKSRNIEINLAELMPPEVAHIAAEEAAREAAA